MKASTYKKKVQVRKWGNSAGILLPKTLLGKTVWITLAPNKIRPPERRTTRRPAKPKTQTALDFVKKWFGDCADYSEAEKKYVRLVKQHHPDVGGNAGLMQEINIAFECLTKQTQ